MKEGWPIQTIIDYSEILKLLGDKTRLTMLKIMESSECCVCQFTEMFEMSQPAISQHLRKLKDFEIIKEEKRKQWVFYSLDTQGEYYPFIQSILSQIDHASVQTKLDYVCSSEPTISCGIRLSEGE